MPRLNQTLNISQTEFTKDGSDIKDIKIILPDHYRENQFERVLRQLAKAGFHLAELLAAIQWQ